MELAKEDYQEMIDKTLEKLKKKGLNMCTKTLLNNLLQDARARLAFVLSLEMAMYGVNY